MAIFDEKFKLVKNSCINGRLRSMHCDMKNRYLSHIDGAIASGFEPDASRSQCGNDTTTLMKTDSISAVSASPFCVIFFLSIEKRKQNRRKKKKTLWGTDSITHVRESNRTERPPDSPFQSKGLDETERPGGVQKLSIPRPSSS